VASAAAWAAALAAVVPAAAGKNKQ
jgi:hypothetical protein